MGAQRMNAVPRVPPAASIPDLQAIDVSWCDRLQPATESTHQSTMTRSELLPDSCPIVLLINSSAPLMRCVYVCISRLCTRDYPVQPSYKPSFSAYLFSRNSIFLSHTIRRNSVWAMILAGMHDEWSTPHTRHPRAAPDVGTVLGAWLVSWIHQLEDLGWSK
jgi:hypothetical protein